MTWLLRTRTVVIVAVIGWLLASAIPLQVPYPTVRAGIQWIELGALTAVLPLLVWLWHRWQLIDELAINPVRLAPVGLDVALVAVMPLGSAALGASGTDSAAHAVVPSAFLGSLVLIAAMPGMPRTAAAVPVGCVVIAMLFGDRPDGAQEPWAFATTAQMSGPVAFGLALALAIGCCCCMFASAIGRLRPTRQS